MPSHRAFWISATLLVLSACHAQPHPSTSTPPQSLPALEPLGARIHDTVQQLWLALLQTIERLTSPDAVAKRLADQTVATATTLIEQVRNGLADDQLERARAALEHLQTLKASVPHDLQQEIARLEAMFADQPLTET